MLECTLLTLRQHVSVAAIWHALHSYTWHSENTLVLASRQCIKRRGLQACYYMVSNMTALLCTACRIALMMTWPSPISGSTSQELSGPGWLCMSRLGPTKAFWCAGRLSDPVGTSHNM